MQLILLHLLLLLFPIQCYTPLGEPSTPGELVPEAYSTDGKRTMTPVGDMPQKQCCGDPALQPTLPPRQPGIPHPDADATDPTTAKLLNAIDSGDPIALKEALKEVAKEPPAQQKKEEIAMEEAEKVAEEQSPTPPPPPPTSQSPSPSPSSVITSQDIGNDLVGSNVNSTSPTPSLSVPSPSSIPDPEEIEEEKIDQVLDNSLMIHGHVALPIQDLPFVRQVTYADDTRVMLSPGKKIFFQLKAASNVNERAPMNLHFVATFRDRLGTLNM